MKTLRFIPLSPTLPLPGAVVCGGPPCVTRLLGNQEATTPGYVAAKKACYHDCREVSVP